MEFQVFGPNTMVTARNRDRSRFAAWGVRGGEAGSTSRFTRNPGRNDQQELANADIVRLEPGDVLRVQGPGGGGYGPPWERDAELVAADVRGGFVSLASARERYGVVIDGGHIDLPATEALRAALRGRGNGAHVDFGAGRRQYEAVMTNERYDALTRILDSAPVMWRFWLKHRILDALLKDGGALPDGAAAVTRAYASLRERLPELREIEAP
jgi:N-methylhydantoinase B